MTEIQDYSDNNDKLDKVRAEFKTLIRKIDWHAKSRHQSATFFLVVSNFFLFSIPLLSSVTTILVATGDFTSGFLSPIFWLSALLTIFSTINTTIKPAAQFDSSAFYREKFDFIKIEILQKIHLIDDADELEQFLYAVTEKLQTLVIEANQSLKQRLLLNSSSHKNH